MAMQKEDSELGKGNEEGYHCPCGHGAKDTGSTRAHGGLVMSSSVFLGIEGKRTKLFEARE